MDIFQIRKLWRKRWKRWRRAIWTCSLFIGIGLLAFSGNQLTERMKELLTQDTHPAPIALETLLQLQIDPQAEQQADFVEEQQQFMKTLNENQGQMQVHLRTVYVCGVEEKSLGLHSADGIYALMNQNPALRGSFDSEGEVWLEEAVADDLSPSCKEQAYISVDQEGNLTLFDGPPEKDKVIQTFFQLDIGSMESSLPVDVVRQLQHGIRVQDIEEYNSVLSTFSDYARDLAEDGMKAH
ncbi:BofC C-terminal domain-containing protein [Paenibacillus sp. F411]|uniref:BofC C-terminal domain-containing protein n=1 Tax=Paenibacillus sp. F411 TaxID=2820239 RepID=UPI001AAE95EF|nr:BofC C-terminal domain-containing protein [Paenibacillus sp. F411]MBO2943430.1 BofC C-terminal domain-containing protein [Paenibacillus sp. F411]